MNDLLATFGLQVGDVVVFLLAWWLGAWSLACIACGYYISRKNKEQA